MALLGVFRPACDDHPELGRRHVEALGDVLPDQDLGEALAAGGILGLDHHLDPFQMSRKGLAGPTGRLGFRPELVDLGPNRAKPGLDLLECQSILVFIKTFGALAVLGALQHLDHGIEAGDPLLGGLVDLFELGIFGGKFGVRRFLTPCPFGGGSQHRLEGFDVVRAFWNRSRHGPEQSIFGQDFHEAFGP